MSGQGLGGVSNVRGRWVGRQGRRWVGGADRVGWQSACTVDGMGREGEVGMGRKDERTGMMRASGRG